MPLPSLEKIIPRFDITIPSTGDVLKFRPFLVKEEKLLLVALEDGDEKAMLDAIIQVVTSCSINPIKVESLANFDLEYIFLQLRARSVGENVELAYKCHNKIKVTPEEIEQRFPNRSIDNLIKSKLLFKFENSDDVFRSCDHIDKVRLNIDEVQVKFNPNHSRQIFLTDEMGLNMRYPNTKLAKYMLTKKETNKKEGINDILTTVAMCVESVFDAENVFTNFQPKEIQEWVEKLTQQQFSKLQLFFETIPKLTHEIEFVCHECGYKEPIILEGLPAFFG